MKRLTPEQQTARLEAAVSNVARAMQKVVAVVDAYPDTIDAEKLLRIETFVSARLSDMVQGIGVVLAKKATGTTFSLDAPLETAEPPRTVPQGRPASPARPMVDPRLGGRLIGQNATPAGANDDDDGVGFIDDED